MKRRPHKIVSVVLLAVLIAGMGMACRIQSLESRNKRWTENTETAGKILTESGKKEAQKQTNGTENDDAAQNAKRVFGDEPAELYARSAVLMDADSGRVLFGKDTDVVRPMASTTKIMTCILALESLREHPDQTIEVSDQAASQPKVHLGMQKGEVFYIKDLLYSLMLESHNDSAVAVAEGIAGSVEEFAKEMNAKAAEIGCKNPHFITPNGLDAEDEGGVHSTTAEDLAKIMRYCIMTSGEKETFLEVTRTKEYQFQDADRKRTFSCHNHNAFLDMMDGALSGKTGFTADAGYCYVGSLRWDDRTFIVALLACGWPNNKGYKWNDTLSLMKYGENYNRIDGSIIMGWLREYNKERCAVADNQSWNTHKAKLSGETSFTSGLSYEEYRNELKLRVEQGDEEAAKALSLSNEIISYLNKRENGKQEAEGDNLLEH